MLAVVSYGERYADRIREMGAEVRPLPLQTMHSEELTVAATSDSPCAPVEPLRALYTMVTRCTRRDATPMAPEETVAPLAGLRMYTLNSAYAMGREGVVLQTAKTS